MFAQLKYSLRLNLDQRLFATAATVVINAVFLALGFAGLLNEGWMTTGIVFSSLSLVAVFVVCVLADAEAIKSLFAAPAAYNVMLTPVPAWKIILGRVTSMVALDIVMYILGVLGVILQSQQGDGWHTGGYGGWRSESITSILSGLIGYFMLFMLFMLIIFACAITKSVLFPLRGRGILGFASILVLLYAGSWLNLLLAPFAEVSRYGAFFSVSIIIGWNPGMIAYLALSLIETVVLLLASAYLYERKVNI